MTSSIVSERPASSNGWNQTQEELKHMESLVNKVMPTQTEPEYNNMTTTSPRYQKVIKNPLYSPTKQRGGEDTEALGAENWNKHVPQRPESFGGGGGLQHYKGKAKVVKELELTGEIQSSSSIALQHTMPGNNGPVSPSLFPKNHGLTKLQVGLSELNENGDDWNARHGALNALKNVGSPKKGSSSSPIRSPRSPSYSSPSPQRGGGGGGTYDREFEGGAEVEFSPPSSPTRRRRQPPIDEPHRVFPPPFMHVPVRKDLFSGRGKEKLANSLKFKSSAEAGLIGGMGGGQQTEAGYKNGNYDKGAQNYDDRQYEDEGYEYAGDRSEGGQENGAGAEVDDEEDIKEDRNGKMIKVPKQLAPSQRGIRESQQLLDNQKALMTQIKDYEYRANACRRAGRRLAEAVAHYCMGVLYDNLRKFKMAIDCYLQFLEILKFTQDTFMEALGHNSIGVSYFKLGTQYYDRALFHHARHSDIADVPGQFIAYSNMGLIYYHMKQFANAADQHKQALKCAITMSSVTGQSIAIGNLGNMQFLLTDLAGARACTERHLELSISLEDLHAQMAASLKLGEICMRMEDFDSSFFFFNQALSLAATLRDKETVAQAKVKIGLLKGQSQLHQRMANMGRAVEDAMMNLRVAAVQEQQEQEAKMQRKLAELERHKKEQADAQAAIAAALAEKEKAKGAVMRKSTEKKKKDGEE